MNHGVSEEHQVHTSASDTLVILLQVHLESFFKTFKRRDLKKEQNKIVKFDKPLCDVWQEYTEETVWGTPKPWFLELLHSLMCKLEQCPERGLVSIDDQVWTTFFFNSFFFQWFKMVFWKSETSVLTLEVVTINLPWFLKQAVSRSKKIFYRTSHLYTSEISHGIHRALQSYFIRRHRKYSGQHNQGDIHRAHGAGCEGWPWYRRVYNGFPVFW